MIVNISYFIFFIFIISADVRNYIYVYKYLNMFLIKSYKEIAKMEFFFCNSIETPFNIEYSTYNL